MSHSTPTAYSTSPEWADIIPIPLDEGPGDAVPLASIAYSPQYTEAMAYLRAVMAANEYSPRTLQLTAAIIDINPAHYTVWLYRAKIVKKLDEADGGGDGVLKELKWLEGTSKKILKNYQIWHHRQLLISTLPSPPPTETAFLRSILALDSKNYHVWTYRQWLVRHFSLFDSPSELAAVETLLREDVRNNSAWNHRWFLCFGREEHANPRETDSRSSGVRSRGESVTGSVQIIDEDLIEREIAFACAAVLTAPQNQSPWNYLRGLYRKSGRPIAELRNFAEQFTGPGGDVKDGVRSSHALDVLAEIYAGDGLGSVGLSQDQSQRKAEGEEAGVGKDPEMAKKILLALGSTWDPIRKGYWDYRIQILEAGQDALARQRLGSSVEGAGRATRGLASV